MSEQFKSLDLNKILLGAIVGLLTWNIYTTHALAIQVAVLDERVATLTRSIDR